MRGGRSVAIQPTDRNTTRIQPIQRNISLQSQEIHGSLAGRGPEGLRRRYANWITQTVHRGKLEVANERRKSMW